MPVLQGTPTDARGRPALTVPPATACRLRLRRGLQTTTIASAAGRRWRLDRGARAVSRARRQPSTLGPPTVPRPREQWPPPAGPLQPLWQPTPERKCRRWNSPAEGLARAAGSPRTHAWGPQRRLVAQPLRVRVRFPAPPGTPGGRLLRKPPRGCGEPRLQTVGMSRWSGSALRQPVPRRARPATEGPCEASAGGRKLVLTYRRGARPTRGAGPRRYWARRQCACRRAPSLPAGQAGASGAAMAIASGRAGGPTSPPRRWPAVASVIWVGTYARWH